MKNEYENLIFDGIASGLSLDIANLRLFPVVSVLPDNDADLFTLLDIVPGSGLIFKTNNVPNFSETYWNLLEAQKPSMMNNLAITNYKKKQYWIEGPSATEVPIYTPSCSDVKNSIATGSSVDITIDSDNYPLPDVLFFPSYPSIVVNQTFLNFNRVANGQRFILRLHFDNTANIPLKPAGWFTSGAFNYAYHNKSAWVTGGDKVTWDALFGKNGILKYINSGLLVAMGITIELQVFGNYDENVVKALQNNPDLTVWPFYLNSEYLTQTVERCDDESVKITISTDQNEIFMLGMQVASVSGLMN